VCNSGLWNEVRTSLGDGSHQIAGLQMEHMSGATRQGFAHQQRLTACVYACEEAALVQPTAERLLAHNQLLRPGCLLSRLIAGRVASW